MTGEDVAMHPRQWGDEPRPLQSEGWGGRQWEAVRERGRERQVGRLAGDPGGSQTCLI